MSQRTPQTDTGAWTPFGGEDTDTNRGRPVDKRPDGLPETWTIIDGGHALDLDAITDAGTDAPADDGGFDAAVDDALATVGPDESVDAVEDATVDRTVIETAVPAPAEEAVPETAETPAPSPVESPAETAPEPDSAPRTPHPAHTPPETETAAETGTETAETPHSAIQWRRLFASLNPGGVLYKQQASIAEVVRYAREANYSANPLVRALEIGWCRAVAVPSVFTLYVAAAVLKRLWRAVGTAALASAWTIAVHTSPLDASTVWTWALIAYWTAAAVLVPAITKK